MKLFKCQHCGQIVFFENERCERCGYRLGYIAGSHTLSALEPEGDTWGALADGGLYRFCTNAAYHACNWLVPAHSPDRLCLACRHNRTIPNLDTPRNLLAWRVVELAKHRLIYSLLKLGLPLETRAENPEHGLVFDFLADPPDAEGTRVMTGHEEGQITIALAEADDVEREKRRQAMGERYRTVLGHFRHEVGHHFWDRLVRGRPCVEQFRSLFGDERPDYGEALKRHYAEGPPRDWQERYISAYASTHPWEDFAETWAHYLHMVDTLETAGDFGVSVHPKLDDSGLLTTRVDFDPYETDDVQRMLGAWLALSAAMNSVNRSMGQADFYPFVLSPPVMQKLGFVHELVRASRGAAGSGASQRANAAG